MNTKKTNLLRIVSLALLGLFGANIVNAGIFQWQDTFVGYRFSKNYREPYNPNDITKYVFHVQHSDGYAWGSNFLNIDMLRSCTGDDLKRNTAETGATEYYAVYRNTLSAEKILGQCPKFGGIVRDIGLTIGFDANTKNDAYGSQVRELFFGPTVSFNVPGFLTVGLLLDKENNKAFGEHIYYDPTYCVSVAWGIPVLETPFTFKGFANFIGTKGHNTAPETYIEAAIMVDPFFKRADFKGKFLVGFGYQYWRNKFGNDATYDPTGGSTASCVQLQAEYHF